MSDVASRRSGTTPLRLFLLVFAGVLAMQSAWMLSVPAFRGLDEHEHAYKAAAVSRGQWSPHVPESAEGWGGLVEVPQDIADAARPVCESLPFTNCDPEGDPAGGTVTVPSSASAYNPVFYFVVGTVARPFSGSTALYAMRAAGAVMCALLIAGAFVTTRRWARSPWPIVSLTVACSPVLLYSTSVAAPNGVEMAGALLAWSAALGLANARTAARSFNAYLLAFTLGAVPLLLVRSLGPLWLVLILLCVAPLFDRQRVADLARLRTAWTSAATVIAGAAGSGAYTLWAGTNRITTVTEHFGSLHLSEYPTQVFMWAIQSVAAFPARDELAPAALYGLVFSVWWVLTVMAFRRATGRARLTMAGIAFFTFAVPIAITAATYDMAGVVWQGRYGLPLLVGFFLVCGWTLDARAAESVGSVGSVGSSSYRIVTLAWCAFFVAQAVGVLTVLLRLAERNALGADWTLADPVLWAVPGLVAVGTAVAAVAASSPPTRPADGLATAAPSLTTTR